MTVRWFRELPIGKKIALLTATLASCGFAAATLLTLLRYEDAQRQSAREHARALASMVAEYSAAAVVFDDRAGAEELLSKLQSNGDVRCARLSGLDGEDIALWSASEGTACSVPANRAAGTVRSGADANTAYVAVSHDGGTVGYLALQTSTAKVESDLRRAYLEGVAVLLVLCLLCLLLAAKLQRLITLPVLSLAAAARRLREAPELTERVQHEAKDEVGELYESFNAMLDELEFRRAERTASEARLRALLEALPDLVFLMNQDGVYKSVLAGPPDLLARGEEELLGRSVSDVLGEPIGAQVVSALRRTVQTGESTRLDYELDVPAGRRRFEGVVIRVQAGDEAAESLALIVARDVTERSALEQRVRDSQKMEALGQLAGGVAHDFNNLLTGIMGYAELCLPGTEGETREALEGILSAAKQASDLTAQLLTFSRRKSPVATPVDCKKIVSRVAKMVGRTIDRRIDIQVEAADDAWVVGDESHLESAVLNLAVNARDAMPNGGNLSIALDRVSGPLPSRVSKDRSSGTTRWVRLTVEDTGVGIPDEIQHRIFDPFFTTKQSGEGTGLGLSTAYGVFINHGGHIALESTPGQGTRFEVYLPQASPGSTRPPSQPPPPSADGSILVVDDDPIALDVCQKLLGSLGYEAIGFDDPARAIAYYEAHKAEVQLVLLDMMMPKMGGPQVAERLRRIEPEVRIVIISGFSEESIDGVSPAGFIKKPYTRANLGKTVAECIP